MFSLRIAEERKLCKQCERAGVSDVGQYRLMMRAKQIAEYVIDREGSFSKDAAQEILGISFPEEILLDALFSSQVQNTLKYFLESGKANIQLRQLSFPLANPWVDKLIRFSVCKSNGEELEKRDISIAILIALLMPLRQSVGSCFATATIIAIQRDNPAKLFEDLFAVINRGSLKRVVDGKEHKVPLAIKTGLQNLVKVMPKGKVEDPILQSILPKSPPVHTAETVSSYIEKYAHNSEEAKELFKAHTQSPLMKCFEYTLAAFADFNVGFARWNFATAIGLIKEDVGGIGEVLYIFLNEELENKNEKIAEYASMFNRAQDKIRSNEAQFRAASSQFQMRRLKREAEAEFYQMNTYESLYHEEIAKSKAISELYKFMVDQYQSLFSHYFQEIYDPEIFQKKDRWFVDSPAGFRLTYKHGRYDPTVWSEIETDEEYITYLTDFFRLTETILLAHEEYKEVSAVIEDCVSKIIQHVGQKEFIEFSKKRILAMHKKYLPSARPISPYAYIAGGSLSSLMQSYLTLNHPPKEEGINPKNAEELLFLLIEFMKDLPGKYVDRFEDNPHLGMLIRSPSHAFVFLPGKQSFKEAWRESANTHTYIRDQFIKPRVDWFESASVETEKLPKMLTEYLNLPLGSISFKELQKYLEKQSHFPNQQMVFDHIAFQMGMPRPIVFADSNWICDYLAFIVDPVTYEISLCRYNGLHTAPITHHEVFFNETSSWSIFPELDEYL